MNWNNKLLKFGFERKPNTIWDSSIRQYVQDCSKNNYKWTYIYKMSKEEWIKVVINRRSLSLYQIEIGIKETLLFQKKDHQEIKSFSEVINSLPTESLRNLKIKSILG